MTSDQVWRNRVQTEIQGILIPFISRSDLIENKRQTERLRDLADIEELTRIPDIDLWPQTPGPRPLTPDP